MEFLSFIATTPGAFLLMSGFILFIFLVKRIFSILVHAAVVAIASAAFPFIVNYLGLAKMLGIQLTPNLDSALLFVTLGLAVYVVFLVGKIVYSMLGFLDKKEKKVVIERKEKPTKPAQ